MSKKGLLLVVLVALLAPPSAQAFKNTKATQANEIQTYLQELKVAPEVQRVGYLRSDFKHWVDHDKNGCDTRREVLFQESQLKSSSCSEYKGSWLSIYDNQTITDPTKLDIDHVVALAEAWDSGANLWTKQQRQDFANDLTSPYSLVAVSASSNRKKSDKDFSDYQASTKTGRCFLAESVIITKWRWSLTIDERERKSLLSAINSCPKNTPVAIEKYLPNASIPPKEPVTPITPQPADNTPSIAQPEGYNCPSTHPIKGNISKERIYHTPNSPYYTRTKPEECFKTAEDAITNGYRGLK